MVRRSEQHRGRRLADPLGDAGGRERRRQLSQPAATTRQSQHGGEDIDFRERVSFQQGPGLPAVLGQDNNAVTTVSTSTVRIDNETVRVNMDFPVDQLGAEGLVDDAAEVAAISDTLAALGEVFDEPTI